MEQLDTLRLILTRKCNYSCSYCCNNIPEITNEIVSMTDQEIYNYLKYNINIKNVCITGGEIFLEKEAENLIFIHLLLFLFPDKNFYFYTNGSHYINIIDFLKSCKMYGQIDAVKGINISYEIIFELKNLIVKQKRIENYHE